jgi:response regulator of citrate/malate metabolism
LCRDEKAIRELLDHGAFDYYPKPFNDLQFKEAILSRIF